MNFNDICIYALENNLYTEFIVTKHKDGFFIEFTIRKFGADSKNGDKFMGWGKTISEAENEVLLMFTRNSITKYIYNLNK